MSVVNGQVADQDTFNNAFGSKQSDNTFIGKQTLNRPASGAQVDDVQQAINDGIADALTKIPLSQKGAANGVVPLDGTSLIDPIYLPSYVDDVLEYVNFASFPVTGETGKIYIDQATNQSYRWTGTFYFQLVDYTDAEAVSANNTFGTDSSSGSDIALPSPGFAIVELINGALISIETIVAPVDPIKIVLINKTGADVVLRDEAGAVAADRIKTGKGSDFTLKNDSMLLLAYSSNSLRWFIAGGSSGDDVEIIKEIPVGVIDGVNDVFTFSDLAINAQSVWVFVDGVYVTNYSFTLGVTESSIQFTSDIPVVGQIVEVQYFKTLANIVTPPSDPALVPSGTVGAPNVITAAGGITTSADQRQYKFVVSNGGPVTVTANPQIQNGTVLGQELIIEGTSDTDYPILNDGTGLAMNGTAEIKNEKKVYFVWNGIKWSEISRT